MNDAYPPRPPTRVLRWVRAYAPHLRDRYPTEDQPADELMELLEQADLRYGGSEQGDDY